MKYTSGQKAYWAALQDPKWKSFRDDFISTREYDGSAICDNCGENGTLDVHHKLYKSGFMPWEYEYDELRLLCRDCHSAVHDLEYRLRSLALTIDVHETHEFNDLLDELEQAQRVNNIKVALARCKNAVRSLNFGDKA